MRLRLSDPLGSLCIGIGISLAILVTVPGCAGTCEYEVCGLSTYTPTQDDIEEGELPEAGEGDCEDDETGCAFAGNDDCTLLTNKTQTTITCYCGSVNKPSDRCQCKTG
ncbi:MAG: hypothetical protein GY854_00400 [Deltaproteobacteria bacterium]|nr:hypothetical protein [Deltaproteobacteria bacterium]